MNRLAITLFASAAVCALSSASSAGLGDTAIDLSAQMTIAADEHAATEMAPLVENDKAVAAIDAQIKGIDTTAQGWRTKLPMPKVVEFDKDHDYFVRMETNKGPILIKFLPDVAPMHVTAFMYLTKLGFYDGLNFHRVITGFMAQGGDPLGNGRGGPGYGFGGEFDPGVKHNRPGLLSMANTGQPNSDGSQFFLTFVPTPWLDGKHTIFGEVVEGMDTVKALEAVGSKGGQTSEPVGMQVVKVEVRKKS